MMNIQTEQIASVFRCVKYVKMLFVIALFWMLAAFPLHAQDGTAGSQSPEPDANQMTTDSDSDTVGGGDTSADSEPIAFDEAYYSQFFYTWEDESGATRRSCVTEPATVVPQMIALIREIYTNPAIPGFRNDKAWTRYMAESALSDAVLATNRYEEVPYNVWKKADGTYEENPYGIYEDVEAPLEGCTALMVEVDDDYHHSKLESTTCEDYLNHIKRITLLTKQRYIDETVSENPGYLFNYVGALNRFFLITKGNNRIPLLKDEKNKEVYMTDEDGNEVTDDYGNKIPVDAVGTAPFYNMFEEFSPANTGPTYGAYAGMGGGTLAFNVDHNCGSVMSMTHTIMMSPDPDDAGTNPDDVHDYAVNFMFVLPDYRFYCDSRNKPDTENYYEWYTYYDTNHQPYFFFIQLTAHINEKPQVIEGTTDNRQVKVKVEWESTYNDIVGYKANEDHYVYRVINDFIQNDPVPVSEFMLIDDPHGYRILKKERDAVAGTTTYTYQKLNADGTPIEGNVGTVVQYDDRDYITSSLTHNAVYVIEPQNRVSSDVYYIVKSRRSFTDFELTESNIVDTNIPGYNVANSMDIALEGIRTSVHDIVNKENHYTHKIYMVGKEYNSGVSMKWNQLEAGGKFRLMRTVIGPDTSDDTQAELIQTFTINNIVEDNTYNQRLIYGVIYDEENNKVVTTAPSGHPTSYGDIPYNFMRFKAALNNSDDVCHLDESVIELPDKTKMQYLLEFTDEITVDTSTGEHPASYQYYIDYERPADSQFTELDVVSNIYNVIVPKNTLKVGYVAYSQEEIQSDSEYMSRLQATDPAIQFSLSNNVNIDSYGLYKVPASGAVSLSKDVIVRATRLSSGRLYIESREKPKDGSSTTVDFNFAANVFPQTGVDPYLDVPYGLEPGQDYVLVTKYKNGNTYGNVIRTLYDIPRPKIKQMKVRIYNDNYDGEQHHYYTDYVWHAIYPDNEETAEEDKFGHYGYRAWFQPHFTGQAEAKQPYSLLYSDNVFSVDNLEPEEPEEPAMAPRRIGMLKADEVTDPTAVSHTHILASPYQTDENALNVPAHVRLYAALPANMTITPTGTTSDATGYVVSDTSQTLVHNRYDDFLTGIESVEIDENAPVEYYNLQGLRILNPEPGSIVIRRQGSKVSKIRI